MTVTYLGSLSIGQALPGAAVAASAGIAGINAALPDILGRLAALQAFSPSPVSFSAQLALAQDIVTGIQQSIALGIPEPSIAAQIAAVAGLVADLLAQVAGVHAQLDIVTDFASLLGAAGIHVLAYAGAAGDLAGELGGALGAVPGISPGDTCNAVAMITTVPAVWAALAQIVKVA